MATVTQMLLLFGALCHAALSTPSHSSRGGVTECQDALLKYHNALSSSRTDCKTVPGDLNTILSSCRPSDQVYMVAILRGILNKHYYGTKCGMPSQSATGCAAVARCLRPALSGQDITSKFTCDENSRNARIELSVNCLLGVSQTSCAMRGIVIYTLRSMSRQICGGPACVKSTGIFQTVPDSKCHKWTLIPAGEVERYSFNVAPGTMFDSSTCSLRFDNKKSTCHN